MSLFTPLVHVEIRISGGGSGGGAGAWRVAGRWQNISTNRFPGEASAVGDRREICVSGGFGMEIH